MRRNRWLYAPLLSVAGACAPLHELTDVPIVDASAVEVEAIREELRELEGAFGLDGVGLAEIRVQDELIRGYAEGSYNTTKRKVRIHRHSRVGLMRLVVRHEVCHAFDVQNGNLSRHADLLIDANAALTHPDAKPLSTDKSIRREGFADLCGLGPGPASALQDPAHAELGLAGASSWLASQGVYSAPESPVLEPWLVLEGQGFPNIVLQTVEQTLILVYGSDAQYYGSQGQRIEEPPPADLLPFQLPTSSYYDLGTFEGDVEAIGTSASGATMAFVRPSGSSHLHLFGRVPGGMWAAIGATDGAYLTEHEGVLTVGWTQETVFRLDRVY